jgi:hypothetical protein
MKQLLFSIFATFKICCFQQNSKAAWIRQAKRVAQVSLV